MSVVRVTTITFDSNEAANILKESYLENAPNEKEMVNLNKEILVKNIS